MTQNPDLQMPNNNLETEFLMTLLGLFLTGFLVYYFGVPMLAQAFF